MFVIYYALCYNIFVIKFKYKERYGETMFKYLSLFSGIGAFEKALTRKGVQFELLGYCEIDKFASRAYSLLHNVPESMNFGDITALNEKNLPTNIDLLTYGFPCQDISIAGGHKGFFNPDGTKTRSGLFFEALRIISYTKPKVAIAENVKNLTTRMFSTQFSDVLSELESAGYNNYWKVLNAKNYGVPQNRERVLIVSIRKDVDTGVFEFPGSIPLKTVFSDLLERGVSEKYFLSAMQIEKMLHSGYRTTRDRIQSDPVCYTLKARDFKGPKCVKDGDGVRTLTPKEYFRLMGFNDSDVDLLISNNFSKSQIYKMAGNSIVVNMLEFVFDSIFNSAVL